MPIAISTSYAVSWGKLIESDRPTAGSFTRSFETEPEARSFYDELCQTEDILSAELFVVESADVASVADSLDKYEAPVVDVPVAG